MAIVPDRTISDVDERDFDTGALVRTAFWGVGAAGALFLAVLAAVSNPGSARMAAAVSAVTGQAKTIAKAPPPTPTQVAMVQPQPQLRLETRRLHEQVRLLAADRDRLAQRIGALERDLQDVTGSIRRQEASVKEALAKAAPPVETPPSPAPAARIAASAASWPANPAAQTEPTPFTDDPPVAETLLDVTASLPPETPLPRPAASAVAVAELTVQASATKPESQHEALHAPPTDAPASHTTYGVDLGGAISIDRLRLLWQTLRTTEAGLLQGLRAITRTRGTKRGGRPDVRLIVGPLPNAHEAAKLCTAILNAGRYCEPAVFHGERLSAR